MGEWAWPLLSMGWLRPHATSLFSVHSKNNNNFETNSCLESNTFTTMEIVYFFLGRNNSESESCLRFFQISKLQLKFEKTIYSQIFPLKKICRLWNFRIDFGGPEKIV